MKWWAIFILFILPLNSVKAQVHLSNQSSYSVNGNVSILKEEDSALSIQQAWRYYQQRRFTPFATPTNSVNKGFVKSVYWIAVPIKNILANSQSLEAGIINGGVFHLVFYLLSDSGRVMDQYITGTRYDFYSRPVKNRHYYFPVNLQANSGAVIFYRIDMRGNGFDIPLEIVKKEFIDGKEWMASMFYAFYSGWMAFVAFLSLITYLWTKDRVYIFYCLYVLSGCLFFIGDGNYDFQLLYPHWPGLATISPTIYGLALCFFMLLFSSDFLQLKATHRKLFLVARGWALLLITTMLLLVYAYTLSENIGLRTFVFGYLLFSITGAWVVQIYAIIRRILDKYKPAYLYGAALVSVFISVIIYVLHVLGKIGDLVPTYIYIPLGFAVEIIILSFALIYSYNFHKRQHQHLSATLADEQLNFSRGLIKTQEAEQKRIAEDLHDELGGNLAAIKMNLQSLHLQNEGVSNTIIHLIDKASDSARNIAHNLMPPEFAKTSLHELLTTYYNQLNNEDGLRFNFHVSGANSHFSKEDELMIYRIVMELTNNIIKHAGATEATVQLLYNGNNLEIMAEDNGNGFSPAPSNGMGIANIESRVNYLQGKINIDTSTHGTTIIIKLPYKK